MRFTEMAKSHHPRTRRRPARFAFFLVMMLAAAAAAGWLVMALWNAVLVEAMGAKPLGYWQALGLLLLCRVLFGNWGPRRGGRFGPPGAAGAVDGADEQNPKGPRAALAARWACMDPAQRAQLRAKWQSRCATPSDSDDATDAAQPADRATPPQGKITPE